MKKYDLLNVVSLFKKEFNLNSTSFDKIISITLEEETNFPYHKLSNINSNKELTSAIFVIDEENYILLSSDNNPYNPEISFFVFVDKYITYNYTTNYFESLISDIENEIKNKHYMEIVNNKKSIINMQDKVGNF